jgi:hypothetical protein
LNQSISGAAYRFFVTEWTWTAEGFDILTRANAPGPLTLKVVVYGLQIGLLLAAAWAMGRGSARRRTPDAAPQTRLALECSLVLLLMVLLSPMSSKPHFCTLILPAFLLARQAVLGKSRVAGVCLGAAILSGALATKDLAGANLASLFMWYGGVGACAFFLLLGCTWILVREPQIAEEVPAPTLPRSVTDQRRVA